MAAAALAISRLAKEAAGGPAQEIITEEDGVDTLISVFRATGSTPMVKDAVKHGLRYLVAYKPAKLQMEARGVLKPREQTVEGDDPFQGLE